MGEYDKGFLTLGDEFTALRAKITDDTLTMAKSETVSEFFRKLESYGRLSDYEQAVTMSTLFEVLLRVGLVRKLENRLKLNTCERLQNETGGAVVALWFRLYDKGYRAGTKESEGGYSNEH